MARLFDDASSQSLRNDAWSVITAPPFVLSAWFRADNNNQHNCFVSLADKDAAYYHALMVNANFEENPLAARSYNGTVYDANATGSLLSGAWYHGIGLWVAANDRRVFLNGGGKGTNSGTPTVANIDQMTIGISADSTPYGPFDGRIAEAAIWDLSNYPGATASDKADYFEVHVVPALAARFSPLFFPLGLVAYYPLGGIYDADDGDHDIVGGYNMTPQNSPTTADHVPGMIYPSPAIVVPSAAAAPFAGVRVNRTIQLSLAG